MAAIGHELSPLLEPAPPHRNAAIWLALDKTEMHQRIERLARR
jgi:hypothetical protein